VIFLYTGFLAGIVTFIAGIVGRSVGATGVGGGIAVVWGLWIWFARRTHR
jgi:uncharacterized protein (TIGR03382 family)